MDVWGESETEARFGVVGSSARRERDWMHEARRRDCGPDTDIPNREFLPNNSRNVPFSGGFPFSSPTTIANGLVNPVSTAAFVWRALIFDISGAGMGQIRNIFATLVRTHHITSRKKLARVKKAAALYNLQVIIRSGGSPGIMYAEGPDEAAVCSWVSSVQALRYKDFQCAQKPAANQVRVSGPVKDGGFEEVTSVAEFGKRMEQRGLGCWWRIGMGYEASS
ncbi:hypothetical protein F5Y13DRAFT_199015 [Hypoxylon sp. FL1857]|nr:hypothetical protein F5Y13DRAFT_199015 [Hypoxylon sp. FL1857]